MSPGSQAMPSLAVALAEIAHDAGRLIMTHYGAQSEIRTKSDLSPVTAADVEAESLIEARLRLLEPGTPIIAEEAAAAGRKAEAGRRFFLVDPLDGTKEFIRRNDEFTVNIALVENGNPVCGVVLAPAKGRLFAGHGASAFELAAPEDLPLNFDMARPIRARAAPATGATAVASRSHRDRLTDTFLAQHGIANVLAVGSSLKFCLIATGEADIYPRHGRTMEWDTAAGQAVLQAAGGSVTTLDGAPLRYGKVEAAFANPPFLARGAV